MKKEQVEFNARNDGRISQAWVGKNVTRNARFLGMISEGSSEENEAGTHARHTDVTVFSLECCRFVKKKRIEKQKEVCKWRVCKKFQRSRCSILDESNNQDRLQSRWKRKQGTSRGKLLLDEHKSIIWMTTSGKN